MSAASSTIANGAIDGLMASSRTGQPNRSPRAMKKTTHRSVFPTTTAPTKRGQFSASAISGHVHAAGRHWAITVAVPTMGTSQNRKAGRTTKGTNRYRAIGGWMNVRSENWNRPAISVAK